MRASVRRRSSLVIAVVVLLGAGTFAAAQGPFAPSQGPFDAILTKLDALADAIAALRPGTPQPGPVTLSTGLVLVNSTQVSICHAVNVGPTRLSVHIDFVDPNGTVLSDGGFNLDPEHGTFFGLAFPPTALRCRFTFTGFASNLRGTLNIAPTTSQGVPSAVLDAR